MKTIEILSKGIKYELILDDDIELPAKPYITNGYAFFKVYREGNSRKRGTMSVQRYVMGLLDKGDHGKGIFVDHINRNKLDNRKENLRLSNNKQNQGNRVSKGYTWNKQKRKFQVGMTIGGKYKHVKDCVTEEEARKVYIKKHIEVWGEYSPYFNK